MGTQKTTLRTNFSSARIAKPSTGGLLVMSPLDNDATVAANVIKSYTKPETVETEHGADSDLALSAPYALANVQKWHMAGWEEADIVSVGSRTFGANPGPAASTGTLPVSETNIYILSGATIDGTAVTRIKYTANDPTTETLDNSGSGEIWFNPYTRAFKTSRPSSGTGAGIILTYKRAKLSPLFAQTLQKPVKTLTFGGNWRYNAQYLAVWRTLLQFCDTNDLMGYGAVEDSADPADADFQALVAVNRFDCFQLVAAKQTFASTEDLGVAYAALNSKTLPGYTLKDQLAPRGIVYATSLPYTRDEYGDDVDPNVDTFHKIGVNAICPSDDGGTSIISSERCTTDYSDSTIILFGGTRKQANATNDLVRAEVNRVLTDGKASAKVDKKGLATVRGAIWAGLGIAASAGYIDPDDSTVNTPELQDVADEERRKRTLLDDVSIGYRVINPLQTIFINAEVFQ